MDCFKLAEKFAEGSYGAVYFCSLDRRKRSVKELPRDTLQEILECKNLVCKKITPDEDDDEAGDYIQQEIDIMKKVNHKNILKLFHSFKEDKTSYLVLKLCNGGCLTDLRKKRESIFNEKFVRQIAFEIAEGLCYLNDNNIMHRDMKLDNIFINFPGYKKKGIVPDSFIDKFDPQNDPIEIIIGDLGLAKENNKLMKKGTICGTPDTMAPEIVRMDEYDGKCDIWSFGAIVYELLYGFSPFKGKTWKEIINPANFSKLRIPKNIPYSLNSKALLNDTLKLDPKERITYHELLKHPFFTEEIKCDFQYPTPKKGRPSSLNDLDDNNSILFTPGSSVPYNKYSQRVKSILEINSKKVKKDYSGKEIFKKKSRARQNQIEIVKDNASSERGFSSLDSSLLSNSVVGLGINNLEVPASFMKGVHISEDEVLPNSFVEKFEGINTIKKADRKELEKAIEEGMDSQKIKTIKAAALLKKIKVPVFSQENSLNKNSLGSLDKSSSSISGFSNLQDKLKDSFRMSSMSSLQPISETDDENQTSRLEGEKYHEYHMRKALQEFEGQTVKRPKHSDEAEGEDYCEDQGEDDYESYGENDGEDQGEDFDEENQEEDFDEDCGEEND
ncbi:unnamed protein product [Moneuplotes crassus]|uniref:Protein kinase domain-containing protein n=1 Tax=Euplotes crassus TaxID=5936 RepID=A0AAD1U5C7_EUPCR|nr:unnamed protein product [Moneuplotes crassus]